MSTKTITITDPANVRVGDRAEFVSALPGWESRIRGDILKIREVDPSTGFDIGYQFTLGSTSSHTTVSVRAHSSEYVLVSATREVPEWEPGTVGTATLNNLVSGNSSVGLRAMRTLHDGVFGFALENGLTINDDSTPYSVSDFAPDGSKTTLRVTKTVTREELADALARHYGDHDSLAAVGEPSTRQNYLDDAATILALLGGESR